MSYFLHTFNYLLLAGVLTYANPGVLEDVAQRRMDCVEVLICLKPQTPIDDHLLVATANCQDIGRSGILLVYGRQYPVIVVDCESITYRGRMDTLGLLADINNIMLARRYGQLALEKHNQWQI